MKNAYQNFIRSKALPFVLKKGFGPNQLTMVAIGVSFFIPLAFFAHPLLGLLFIVGSSFMESTDGVLSEEHEKKDKYVQLFKTLSSHIREFFIMAGFWLLFWRSGEEPLSATFLVFLGFMLVSLGSLVKSRTIALGGECNVGVFSRDARLIYAIIWVTALGIIPGFFTAILWIGLVLYLILVVFTVFQRLLNAINQLKT